MKEKELLVVVDMQNDFVTGLLGTQEAQKIVPKVRQLIESWTGDIIMTRDTHTDDYLNTAEGRMLPVPHCLRDSDGWQIVREIQESYLKKNDDGSGHFFAIVNKPTFGSVELAEIAGEDGYAKVLLCGVCTDICVISNAMLLRAFLPESEICVNAECCAGVSPESHKIALDSMGFCNIKILNA